MRLGNTPWKISVMLAIVFIASGCASDTVETLDTSMLSPAAHVDNDIVGTYAWHPDNGLHDSVWSGTLEIDAPCVYLDVTLQAKGTASSPPKEPLRSFLRLPEPLIRYDADTQTIWFEDHNPIVSGDEVVATGSEGWQQIWNANEEDGTHHFARQWKTGDDGRLHRTDGCPANVSFWAASLSLPPMPDAELANNVGAAESLAGLFAWDIEQQHADEAGHGVLIVDPPCLYIQSLGGESRSFLRLPRPLVRLDRDTNSIWFGESGPMTTGDAVTFQAGPSNPKEPGQVSYEGGCSAPNDQYSTSVRLNHESAEIDADPISASASAGAGLSGRPDQEADLAGMYGWDPEGGFHDATWTGTLVVDHPCVYVAVADQDGMEVTPEDEALLSLVRLPKPLTSFNSVSGELWVGDYGPMSAGDEVVLVGSEGWQSAWSAVNDDGGMHEFVTDDIHPRKCSAHVSFWTASMRPFGANPAGVPNTAELPGLGLYAWEWDLGHHNAGAEGGVLLIEPPCVYYERATLDAETWEPYDEPYEFGPKRFFLKLPRPFVRFDSDSGALWYRQSGPFVDGDEIVMSGGHDDLSDPLDPYVAAGCTAPGPYRGLHMMHRDSFDRSRAPDSP